MQETARKKVINGQWHYLCTGPAHEEPTWLPQTSKYFYYLRNGRRAGTFTTRCRLCTNWSKLKSPGSHHGYVPVRDALPFYTEAINRIGLMELANRTGIKYYTISDVLYGRKRFVQKAKLRLVMLELISARRKNEHQTKPVVVWRTRKRNFRGLDLCVGCGGALSNYTNNCENCHERKRKRGLSKAS